MDSRAVRPRQAAPAIVEPSHANQPNGAAKSAYRSWCLDDLDEPLRTSRRYAADLAELWNLSALADDAAVVTSELVTNAIRYGKRPIGLAIHMEDSPVALVIEVSDGDLNLPLERMPDDYGGLGMPVLFGYAEITFVVRSDGKAVRARLNGEPS